MDLSRRTRRTVGSHGSSEAANLKGGEKLTRKWHFEEQGAPKYLSLKRERERERNVGCKATFLNFILFS